MNLQCTNIGSLPMVL